MLKARGGNSCCVVELCELEEADAVRIVEFERVCTMVCTANANEFRGQLQKMCIHINM